MEIPTSISWRPRVREWPASENFCTKLLLHFSPPSELVLSTAICLQPDGISATADSAAWQAAVRAWLASLELRVPALAGWPVAIHLNDDFLHADRDQQAATLRARQEAATASEGGPLA